MIKPTFNLEKELLSQGYDFVIGVDEAGRGPLAGPVVAAAVALRNFEFRISNFETSSNFKNSNFKIDSKFKIQNSKFLDKIRDSKTLSEKQREELFDFIHEYFHVGIGICDHRTIDRINILEATYLSMKKAVGSVTRNVERETKEIATRYALRDMRTIILVDGNKIIPNFSMEQQAVVSGDKLVKSISAASIVAKVTRDRIMREMHEKYPQYCFNKHKGYGTALHFSRIKQYGLCDIHRKSFDCHKQL